MFLCDDCHDADAHLALFRSKGPCEGCGKVKICIDCHYPDCRPKQKQTPKPRKKPVTKATT